MLRAHISSENRYCKGGCLALFATILIFGLVRVPLKSGAAGTGYGESTGVPSAYTWTPDPLYSQKTMEDPMWLQYSSRTKAFGNCPPLPPPVEPLPPVRKRKTGAPVKKKAKAAAVGSAQTAGPCPPLLMPVFVAPKCPDTGKAAQGEPKQQ